MQVRNPLPIHDKNLHSDIAVPAAFINVANGIAGLDASAKVPTAQLTVSTGVYRSEGDQIYHAHDAVVTTTSAAYIKTKTVTLGNIPNSTLRIYFNGSNSAVNAFGYFRIYRNGVAVGTQRQTNTSSPYSGSESIAGWSVGDTLELWMHCDGTNLCTASAFRILFEQQACDITNS
jgi:hypothetical protein